MAPRTTEMVKLARPASAGDTSGPSDAVGEAEAAGVVVDPASDEDTSRASAPALLERRREEASTGGRYRLLVFANGVVVETHPLPGFGTVTIGRSPRSAICIHDGSISRKHAVLRIGETITIEDLGSANGTRLRDEELPPHEQREVAPSEIVAIGALSIVIQARFAPAHACHLATHDYFESRLEEECARGERAGSVFAVIRIRTKGVTRDQEVLELLAVELRQSDVLARFGPGDFEILLIDTGRQQAEHVGRRLLASLANHRVTGDYVATHFPQDGRSVYTLMTKVRGSVDDIASRDDLVIADRSMRNLYQLAERIAMSDLCVLILGETGVGKEKLSRAVHSKSPRSGKPFVAINCAALNDSLLESELFGHERGSFTGANAAKAGLLEAAAGGSVLLDEIGDMSLAVQAKLLRVIEEGEVRRVGGLKSRAIDVRFIAATHCDLETATARGGFREDLYFRLSAATLVIPPLRERIAEIELLARRFAGGTEIAPDAIENLCAYSWPGNIRELRNVIERAALLCGPGPITAEHLPVDKMRSTFVTRATVDRALPPARGGNGERQSILDALERSGGNQGKAAELLGISRRTLINRIEQFDLPRPRKPRKS